MVGGFETNPSLLRSDTIDVGGAQKRAAPVGSRPRGKSNAPLLPGLFCVPYYGIAGPEHAR
jgi:hypothetical protein